MKDLMIRQNFKKGVMILYGSFIVEVQRTWIKGLVIA